MQQADMNCLKSLLILFVPNFDTKLISSSRKLFKWGPIIYFKTRFDACSCTQETLLLNIFCKLIRLKFCAGHKTYPLI